MNSYYYIYVKNYYKISNLYPINPFDNNYINFKLKRYKVLYEGLKSVYL